MHFHFCQAALDVVLVMQIGDLRPELKVFNRKLN